MTIFEIANDAGLSNLEFIGLWFLCILLGVFLSRLIISIFEG